MLMRARIVLPVARPPILDGALRWRVGRICPVAALEVLLEEDAPVDCDLGDVILMPGLVNAHCHLDYTSLAGRIPLPKNFTGWINDLTRLKSEIDDEAHERSWLRGAEQCLRNGITTVGNIETRPDLLPSLWRRTPLRCYSFLELILLRANSDAAGAVAKAVDWLRANEPPRGRVGLSPHAPYTTKPELLRICVKAAKEHDLQLAMHVAESGDEDEMFRKGAGPLYRKLAMAGRDMKDCGQESPVAHLARHGMLGKNLLAVHGNYLDEDDIALLAKESVCVVHCPRSHAYFGHVPLRFEALREAGVLVCLGTDSLATVADGADAQLDLFAEMRAFREAFPEVDAETIVRMATINGARALGMTGEVGEVTPKSNADLIAIPYSGPVELAYDAVVNHVGPPAAVMMHGQWIIPPPSSSVAHGG